MSSSASGVSLTVTCTSDEFGSGTFDLAPTNDDDAAAQLRNIWAMVKDVFPAMGSDARAWSQYCLTYLDDEGDEIQLDSPSAVVDALRESRQRQPHILDLFVRPATHTPRTSQPEDEQWERIAESNSPVVGAATNAEQPADLSLESASSASQEAAESTINDAPLAPTSLAPLNPLDGNAASTAHTPPVSVSSTSSWSMFNLFGRATPTTTTTTTTSDTAATHPATPTVTVTAPVTPLSSMPLDASALVLPASNPSQSDSLSLSTSSSSSASLSSSAVLAMSASNADRDFWDMDDSSKPESQVEDGGNSFVRAMDAQFGTARQNMWDSSEVAGSVISRMFTSMLTRAEDRIGLGSTSSRLPTHGTTSFVRAPHQALLDSLRGIDPAAFDEIITQFVQICSDHASKREAEMRQAEEAKLAQLVRTMEAARAAEEAARAAEANAAAERVAEIARQESVARAASEAAAADADREARLHASRVAEESIRLRREQLRIEQAALQAEEERIAEAEAEAEAERARAMQIDAERLAQLAAPGPIDENIPIAGPNPQRPSMVAEVDIDLVALNDSPALVPMVPIPVATPIHVHAHSAASRFNAALCELRAMGFTDDALNTYMLQKTNVDIGATLDWLMADAATGGALKEQLHDGPV